MRGDKGFSSFYREYSRLSYRKIAAKCRILKSTAHRVCGTKKNSERPNGRMWI